MRVALDTDVVVAAVRSQRGASNALLRAVRQGRLTAVASIPTVLEYEAVLMRPEHRRVSGFTVIQVQQFMDGLAALVIPVIPYFLWRPTLRDPNDEMMVDAAVNGHADAIVTFNVRHFLPAAKQFQLDVLTPAQTLWRL
jgi:putative PIN family toxin of toxin-antitoxin system